MKFIDIARQNRAKHEHLRPDLPPELRKSYWDTVEERAKSQDRLNKTLKNT